MTLHPEAQKLADHLYHLNSKWGNVVDEFLEEAIADFAKNHPYDSTNDILPGWCVDDVYSTVKQFKGEGYTVSKDDAVQVLVRAYNRMDANYGICWDILWIHVEDLVREGAIQFIPNLED
jgi:hypothetical protein